MSVITLELRDLAYGGDAVGRYEGQVVFVPGGIPGETVEVEITERRKSFMRGRLLRVLSPAPERVEPPCPYAKSCGGCQWQHIRYEDQLAFKRAIVASELERTGNQQDPLVHPMLGMENPWNYRNHIQLLVGPSGELGYQAARSHEVIPVERCQIAHPLLMEMWESLEVDPDVVQRVSLRAGINTGERMLILEGADPTPPALEVDMPISVLYLSDEGYVTVLAGNSYFHERLAGRLWRISGPSFFQVNTVQAEQLVQTVGRYLALQPGESLLDAYCGVGTLSLPFAAQLDYVLGIEASPWAIEDAAANAEDEENVELLEGAVEEVLPGWEQGFDAVVLDPPRAGVEPEALEGIFQVHPKRIVYVSCDPVTLARDVARLNEMGYALAEVQPIDMFPQTYHIECVALMSRMDQ
jgi:23S rRNA (uracil1939-C5)-methyltransferase